MAKVNVTIIGLHRLGASLGLALKRLMKDPGQKHEFVVVGSDETPSVLDAALKLGAIDQKVRDLEAAVEKADLVFVTAPYSLVSDIFSIIGPALKAGAVVIDTSPLKLAAIDQAKKHFRRNKDGEYEAYLVGVTPILNPEHLEGLRGDTESARADLFDNGQIIISPASDAPEEAVQLIADLAGLLNVRAHFVDPAEHDGLVAAMEQVPALLQLAFFRSLNTSKAWGDLQRMGNPRFSLATYLLAQEAPEDLAQPIVRNRDNVVRALETLIGALDEIRDVLVSGDELTLEQAFTDASRRYERWQAARRKNNWGDQVEPPALPSTGLMGSLGSMLNPFGKKKSKDDDKQK
jgi:prephenate dehydrogenase